MLRCTRPTQLLAVLLHIVRNSTFRRTGDSGQMLLTNRGVSGKRLSRVRSKCVNGKLDGAMLRRLVL